MRTTITTIVLSQLASVTAAFGVIPDIQIVGQPGGAPQKLPGSYVKTFTRWSVEAGNERDDPPTLQRLPTEGDETFVNPTSTAELWWPLDLQTLQVRPCLDILMQGGSPSYALAGLTVRVPEHESGDSDEWRNYGLNSQPLAKQWTTFSFAVEGGFRIECFIGTNADEGVEDDVRGESNKEESDDSEATYLWDRIFPGDLGALNDRPIAHAMFASERMSEALESVGVFLSGIDDSSPLSIGFHLVSFPLTEQWTDLPRLKSEEGYRLRAVATAEPDAEALNDMDEGLVAMTATSVLDIDVLPTASGSDSDYLPQSYRSLYKKK